MSSSLEITERKLHDCEEQIKLKRLLLNESLDEIELQTRLSAQIEQLKAKRLAYRSKITYLRSIEDRFATRRDLADQVHCGVKKVISFTAIVSICLVIWVSASTWLSVSIVTHNQNVLNGKLDKIMAMATPYVAHSNNQSNWDGCYLPIGLAFILLSATAFRVGDYFWPASKVPDSNAFTVIDANQENKFLEPNSLIKLLLNGANLQPPRDDGKFFEEPSLEAMAKIFVEPKMDREQATLPDATQPIEEGPKVEKPSPSHQDRVGNECGNHAPKTTPQFDHKPPRVTIQLDQPLLRQVTAINPLANPSLMFDDGVPRVTPPLNIATVLPKATEGQGVTGAQWVAYAQGATGSQEH